MSDIPSDKNKYERIVQTWQLRMLRSQTWSDRRRPTWVRCYKYYRQIVDQVYDPDEPNVTLGYIDGLINQLTSKSVEPILSLQPPCPVYPTKFGDQQAAKNFENMARSWYAKPIVQKLLFKSKKEMIICGPRWEVDEWQNIQRPGKVWGKIPQEVEVEVIGPDGEVVRDEGGKPVKARKTQMVIGEVERDIPIHYGFNTRYPSVFDMYPEPDRPTIGTGQKTDCSWCIEDMGELALEELAREFYIDSFGRRQPMYDFSELLHDAGRWAEQRYEKIMAGGDILEDNFGRLITPIRNWTYSSDYGRENKDTMYPTEGTVDRETSEDRDKIWVARGYQRDQLVTIAQGKYIIHRKIDPWHYPEMPIRIENFIEDPEFIYGMGIIEPLEDEINLRNDIRNLSMSQFIRSVSKLLMVRTNRIVSMNDFKLPAGGKVRITGDGPLRDAVDVIPTQSDTSEMLALDSELRGEIEFVSSNLDGSPGVAGTKLEHKTKGGMEIIANNLTPVFKTIFRQALVNEALRMQSMQRFMDQFGFEKMPYEIMREDGSTYYGMMNKEDMFTEGRGFRYSIEIDPSFGDTNVQRQDALNLFDLGMKYEEMRLKFNDPRMKKLDLSQLFEPILLKFGWRDISRLFLLEGKSMDPDMELKMIMQGGNAECQGDLLNHIQMHILQRESPNLKNAIESGKANPDTMKNLELLISQAMAKATTFLKDPVAAAESVKGKALMGQLNRGQQ